MNTDVGNFAGTPAESEAKFKELLLYIADRSEGDSSFGSTKANKLLFFADFLAYLNFGRSITGWRYQKMDRGPVPLNIYPVRESMRADGDMLIYERDYHGYKQTKYVACREPDLSGFTAEEISLVDKLIRVNWEKSAKDISDESHSFAGWLFAHDREVIPYEISLISFRPPTPREIEYGLSLVPIAEQYSN